MLVHGDVARLPVRDERDDGVLGTPYLPDVDVDPGILIEVVHEGKPGLHEVYRPGYAAIIALGAWHTEPGIRAPPGD